MIAQDHSHTIPHQATQHEDPPMLQSLPLHPSPHTSSDTVAVTVHTVTYLRAVESISVVGAVWREIQDEQYIYCLPL